MSALETKVAALNKLVESFEYEKAFDEFYDESLLSYENEDLSTTGLPAKREAMQHYLNSISNHTAKPKQLLLSDDISITEWHYVFDHAQWGHRDFNEVSIQRWKDGKIIHERHLYKTDKF